MRSFLCRTSSFLCVSSRELLFRLFACSRSATTHPLNSSFFAACLIDPWAFLLPSARRHRCAHVQLRSCSLPPVRRSSCAAPPPRDDTGALMYRCAPSCAAPPPFSACLPVSFCAACSLVPVLRPHTRSIRASLPLADRSSRDVPLLSPRLARVSVLVSAFRARDRVVSMLAYSVIHALSHTALLLTALSPTALFNLSHTALSHTAFSLTAFSLTLLGCAFFGSAFSGRVISLSHCQSFTPSLAPSLTPPSH